MVIPIAHDFTCPWCWIGFRQVQGLEREFGVSFDWKAYELFPDALDLPGASSTPEVPTNRPKTPTRMALAYAAQGMEKPSSRELIRTHNAHEAVELAKRAGKERALIERLYLAYWERGENINDLDTLIEVSNCLLDASELRDVVESRRFADQIVPFDDEAYASGVYNVPTYWIGGERYAEQPIQALRAALKEALSVG